MELYEFILEHENDDPAALMLQRDRWKGIDAAAVAEAIAARRKLRNKVPEWYANPQIICPLSLSAEQCSSTDTASYKAAVAQREIPGDGRIADLTGGLGVDCWRFAGIAGKVLYNEMNPLLLEAARRNLPLLGCRNIEFSCVSIDPATLPGLLDSFEPDLVYADPARRSEGRKVFLPEDCSPDVLALQDMVLGRGFRLMLKLSPMADISLMLRRFHHVKSVHLIEAYGECKELLLLMEPGFEGDPEVKIAVCDRHQARVNSFDYSELAGAVPLFIGEMPRAGQLLFEPGPALMKSGALNMISECFEIPKCGPSAHLLCIGQDMLADEAAFRYLDGFGKWYLIEEAAQFGKGALRDFASRWPDAEVTARALPLSSDELRTKMKVRGGGKVHIFGLGSSVGRILIAAGSAIEASKETPAPR